MNAVVHQFVPDKFKTLADLDHETRARIPSTKGFPTTITLEVLRRWQKPNSDGEEENGMFLERLEDKMGSLCVRAPTRLPLGSS